MSYSPSSTLPTSNSASFEAQTYTKVTWRLIPFLFLCYVVAYLDRVNVGFAKLQMLNDLRLSETVYGLGAGIFFIGYFFFEVPSNIILHKIGARVWITRIMITWAIVSAANMFATSAASFYVIRFLLGLAEAGFFPGIILYLTYWYPAQRRGRMTALFMTGIPIAGIIGGPLSGWIMHAFTGGSLRSWQWLFLLEAIPSVIVGIITFFYLDDGIRKAKWLTEEEKQLLERNIAEDCSEKTDSAVGDVMRNGKVWLMSMIYFCSVMGLYGISFWLPTLIKQTGVKDPLNIGLLTAIPNLCAVVAMVLISRSADKSGERRWHFAIPSLVGGIGLILSAVWGGNTVLAMIALSIATAGFMTTLPLFWAFPTAILAGTAAAAGIALANSVGNLAGFVAPYLIGWLKDLTHSTNVGMYSIAAFLILGALLALSLPAKTVNR